VLDRLLLRLKQNNKTLDILEESVRYRFGRVRGGMRGDDLVAVAFTPYVKIICCCSLK